MKGRIYQIMELQKKLLDIIYDKNIDEKDKVQIRFLLSEITEESMKLSTLRRDAKVMIHTHSV